MMIVIGLNGYQLFKSTSQLKAEEKIFKQIYSGEKNEIGV